MPVAGPAAAVLLCSVAGITQQKRETNAKQHESQYCLSYQVQCAGAKVWKEDAQSTEDILPCSAVSLANSFNVYDMVKTIVFFVFGKTILHNMYTGFLCTSFCLKSSHQQNYFLSRTVQSNLSLLLGLKFRSFKVCCKIY